MTMTSTLRRVLTALAAVLFCASALAQFTVDFSSSTGAGTAQDKVLIQNIRVLTPVSNPFNPGTFTTVESDYNVVFKFDPATLHLVPFTLTQVGTGSACANLNVQVTNAFTGSALQGATVTIGTHAATTNSSGVASFTGLTQGATSINVAATNFVAATQSATLGCTSTPNTVAVALSPGSGQTGGLSAGQFRVILTWGLDPADLDSHMTGPNADSTRWHVYYSDKTSGGICGLDVDDTTSYGPETITCPESSQTSLRNGIYRYSVHQYAGSGTIGTSSAAVRLEFGNGTVYNYAPPSSGWTGDDDVWTVFELTVNNGTLSVAPVNRITHGVAAHDTQSFSAQMPVIRFGSTEDPNLFLDRSKK
jgi:hypothetical protein